MIPPPLSPPFSRISYFLAIQLFASQSVTIYCWDYCKDVANDESPHAPLGLGPASFPAPTPPNHPPHFFAVPFGAWEQVTVANSVATKSKVNVVRGKSPGCKFEIFMLISHCTDKARGPAASSPAAHLKSRSCGHSARRLKLFNHCVARKKRRTRQEEVWGDGEPWGAAARAGTLRHGRGAPEPPRACRRVGERRARVYTRRAGGLRGLHL